MYGSKDEDDLFNPAASAKLAALFDNTLSPKKTTNESLTYTPPRQPKSVVDLQKVKLPSAVICAKVVALYKSIEGKYALQGKYGLALIGNDDVKAYELIVYKDKKNILTRAKVQSAFSYNLLRDNYASFSDDEKQNWSVLFDNAKDYTEFHTELQTRNVKVVDSVQKTNDCAVAVEAETEAAAAATPAEDDNCQSDNSSGAQLKADILSRMAKMGQAVIPATAAAKSSLSDYADSDSDIANTSRPSRKVKRAEKPLVSSNKPDLTRVTPPQQQQTQTNSEIMLVNQQPQQQQLVSPVIDPFSLLFTESRAHNYEMRMNLNQMSTKIDTVLQKLEQNDRNAAEEDLLRTKLKALELKMANLTKELQETVNENVDLQKKLLESKSVNTNEKDAVIRLQNEKIERLEQQLQEKQVSSGDEINENFRQFVNELTRCTDLAGVRELCGKFDTDDVLVSCLCETLCELFKRNDAKATNFVGTLTTVMQNFQQYIVKYFDAENKTFPAEFISQFLPKSTRTATKYLIKEFEKVFKMSNDEHQALVLKPNFMSLSEFDD